MMMMTRTFIAAAALAACTSAPANPTWQTDVEPVVASNCVRCHGSPAQFGAPPSFRLDVVDDIQNPFTGDITRGAGTMAAYMSARTQDGSMPPVFPLVGDAVDVFHNWVPSQDPSGATEALPAVAGDPRPANQAPTIALTKIDDTHVAYTIDDADGDLVYGELDAKDPVGGKYTPVAIGLQDGVHGAVTLRTSDLADGTYQLAARLDDRVLPATPTDLGVSITVTGHGAVPITATVLAPTRYDIVAPADPTPNLQLCADGGTGPLTATISAFDPRTPTDTIDLGTVAAVASCTAATPSTATWDVTQKTVGGVVPHAGDRYVLRVAVKDTDMTHTPRTIEVPVRIGAPRNTTTETFSSVYKPGSPPDPNDILAGCTQCHNTCSAVPNMRFNWSKWDDTAPSADPCTPNIGVHTARGLIYDRVVFYQDMPPVSAHLLSSGFVPLDETKRARLAGWLLAGAPQQ